MHFQLFQYPLPGPPDLADLNAWLASHRVVAVQQHVVTAPGGALLVFVVQSIEAGTSRTGTTSAAVARKIDYKEALSPEEFSLFSRLRDERKRIADAEGVPVYAVFTNEHLAEMAKRRPATLSSLGSIDGMGKARLEKHGARLLAIIASPAETSPSAP